MKNKNNGILSDDFISKCVKEALNEVLLTVPNQKDINKLNDFLNLYYNTQPYSLLQYNLNNFIDKLSQLLGNALPYIYFVKSHDLGNSFRSKIDDLENLKIITDRKVKANEIKKIIKLLYYEIDKSDILALYNK